MKRIAFFIVSLYCLTACDNMVMDGPDRSEVPIPDETPRIQLFFPEEEVVNVYSTATQYENTIKDLWVLSFHAGTGVLDTLEFIDVAKIVKNGYATQLLPQLSFMPQDGRKIVCIANSRIGISDLPFDPTNPAQIAGYDTSKIDIIFPLNKDNWYDASNPAQLPMYGSFIWGVSSGYTCKMIRAVAKVQVQMGTSVQDVTGNFSAENVSYVIYNHGWEGHIKPDPNGGIRGIQHPSSGFYYTNLRDYYLVQKQNISSGYTHVYLHEYQTSIKRGDGTPINNKTFHSERQCILLKKDNSPDIPTYYRLDFYNPKDSTYFDTKRNHHYMFTINEVRSEGYTSISEALKNPGSNIVYEVRANDVSKQIISNGQYAIVANLKDSVFYQEDPNDRTLTIGSARYHLPPEMSSLPVPKPDTIFFEPTHPSYNPGNPVTVTPTSLPSSFQPIVTVDVYVPTPYIIMTGFVVFKFGNITYKWPVRYVMLL